MIAALAASPHRRAHLAVALLGVIVVVLAGAALWAWSDLDQRATLVEDRRFELQGIAARLKARGPGLARAERTLSGDPFLPGATPTLAANALQRRIVALA
jgi:Flp pilus assembly protein TadG